MTAADRSRKRLEDHISRARSIAASGEMTYPQALDLVALDEGFPSWRSMEAVEHGDPSRSEHGAWRHFYDAATGRVLQLSLVVRVHRRDRWPGAILDAAVKPLLRLGVRPGTIETMATATALIATAGMIPLGLSSWAKPHPAGSMVDSMWTGIMFSFVMACWLAWRWLVLSVDPLDHIAVRTRSSMTIISVFAMCFGAMPMTKLDGTDVTPVNLAVAVFSLVAAPLWIVAMQASRMRAEREIAR
jgi:hypothetical protein